jgi:hypothetical protein
MSLPGHGASSLPWKGTRKGLQTPKPPRVMPLDGQHTGETARCQTVIPWGGRAYLFAENLLESAAKFAGDPQHDATPRAALPPSRGE